MKSFNTWIRKWMDIVLWQAIYNDSRGVLFSACYEGISSPLLHLLAFQLLSWVLFHGTISLRSWCPPTGWKGLCLGMFKTGALGKQEWVRHTFSSQREKLYPLLFPLLLYSLFCVPCNFFRGLIGLIRQYHSAQKILKNYSLFPSLN